jgi:acyl-CoA synthetase (AMP-forming)/AMP-acid ligase II
VPSLWRLALKAGKPPQKRSLKRVFCGSAPLSASLWTEIQQWTGARVANAYGITETASWLAGTSAPDAVVADGLIGVPWGTVVKVLKRKEMEPPPGADDECAPGESGYVWVNTPALMRGYLDRDDLTKAVVSHGWFLTGDIGFLDDRGWLSLRGREREEINKGGMKVYPGDIDAIVERFAETTDACTFAYEDPLYGENIGIAVVLKAPTEETLRRLHQWTAEHLARHQLPMRWYVLNEIPRTSRGKVNRADVARRCESLRPVDLAGTPRPGLPNADGSN